MVNRWSRRGWVAGLALAGMAVLAWTSSCGARDLEAPRASVPDAGTGSCKSLPALMPTFIAALDTGKTENLRRVVQNQLMVGARPDSPPPVNDVLRAVLFTLNTFANGAPERGAAAGKLCATTPPPLAQANPICEMRRSFDLLIHAGKGLDALKLIDPLTAGVLNYIIGRPLAPGRQPGPPHWEIAVVVEKACSQNAVCQLSDGLDLVIGLTDFAQTPAGTAALDHMNAMANNPGLQPFLTDNGAQYGGRAGIQALTKVVVSTIEGMTDPADLDQLPLDKLPAELQPNLKQLLADGKVLLDPKREPNVLRPLKRTLHCLSVEDPNQLVVGMVYDLALDAKLPEFGLTKLAATMKGLRDVDQRGALLYLTKTMATAVRDDEQAIDSAALVCRTLFSSTVAPNESRTNAQLVLPVLADLFAAGAAPEAICAADSIFYGCGVAGTRPACP